jgi:hypothetical protein
MSDTITLNVETADVDGLPRRRIGANFIAPDTGTAIQVEFDVTAGYLLLRIAMKDSATYAINLNEVAREIEALHHSKSRIQSIIFDNH